MLLSQNFQKHSTHERKCKGVQVSDIIGDCLIVEGKNHLCFVPCFYAEGRRMPCLLMSLTLMVDQSVTRFLRHCSSVSGVPRSNMDPICKVTVSIKESL